MTIDPASAGDRLPQLGKPVRPKRALRVCPLTTIALSRRTAAYSPKAHPPDRVTATTAWLHGVYCFCRSPIPYQDDAAAWVSVKLCAISTPRYCPALRLAYWSDQSLCTVTDIKRVAGLIMV